MNKFYVKTSELFIVFTRPIMTSLSQFLSLEDMSLPQFQLVSLSSKHPDDELLLPSVGQM